MLTAVLRRTPKFHVALLATAVMLLAVAGIALWAFPGSTAVSAQDGPGGEADVPPPASCPPVTNATGERTATGNIRLAWANPGGTSVLGRRFSPERWSGGRNLSAAYRWIALSEPPRTGRTANSIVISGTNQNAWYQYAIANTCRLSSSVAVKIVVPPVPETLTPSPIALGGSTNGIRLRAPDTTGWKEARTK